MKKIIICTLFAIAAKCSVAQTSNSFQASGGCLTFTIGGCISYVIGELCTETIHHYKICCGRNMIGIYGCSSTDWFTPNPKGKGEEVLTPLKDILIQQAIANKLRPEDITGFSVKSCEPITVDGVTYAVKKGNYKINKSDAGWSVEGIEIESVKQ